MIEFGKKCLTYIIIMYTIYAMGERNNSGYDCFKIVNSFLGGQNIYSIHENELDSVDEVRIVSWARKAGLKGRVIKNAYSKLTKINTPIIGKDYSGCYFVIVNYDNNGNVIYMYPDDRPVSTSVDEFKKIWDGTAIVIVKKGLDKNNTEFGFKWFVPSILKYKKDFFLVLLAALVIQIIGIFTPLMMQVVVDKVLTYYAINTLIVLTIGIAISYVFELLIDVSKNYLFVHTTNRVDVVLNSRLFKHLFNLPLRYFESRRVGDTIARVRELDTIRNFLTGTPLSALIDLLFVFVYIIVLFFYSAKLTWIVIASIPVYACISLIVTPLFKKCLDEKFRTGANVQSYLVETINGVETVKSFALETNLNEKYGKLQAEAARASYKTQMVASNSSSVTAFIQKVFDLIVLFCGAKAVISGDFSIGQLVAFRMLASRVSGPVLRFVQLYQEFQQASLSVKRIGDIFNTHEEVNSESNINLPMIRGDIRFQDVTFRYNIDSPEVISKMSFVIPRGKMIGVVGKSGSGKSTISKLLQRLYIPEKGKITVDGIDISLVDTAWLRTQTGVVLQENVMMSGTIAENISIHCKNASMDRIINASIIAGAHEFIMKLEKGYDTVIGEEGIGLSGGQKQRIAIARAIINNPRILIFDEATSALDYESESIIQNNMSKICRDRTVIVIAHRLSTLKNADAIMVVDDGKIVEYDTPPNLLKNKGLYYNLHCKQSNGEIC